MIRQWLARLRHWLWAPLFDLTGLVAEGVLRVDDRLRILREQQDRLEKNQVILGESLARVEAFLLVPKVQTVRAKVWDCGHEHTSGAKDRDGVERCLGCHEERMKS